MKVHCSTNLSRAWLLVAWLLAGFVSGCATQPKIDWAARIGSYTFDQAVLELGPPASSAKLSDGTVVSEWLMQHGYTHGFLSTTGYEPYPYYSPVPATQTYVTSRTPDSLIRLTFGPDGKLGSWKKVLK